MDQISYKAVYRHENRKKFNGIEQTNEFALNQYDAFYRTLDPQIGRWKQIDPKCELFESYTPYAHVLNNPLSMSDPLGDDTTHVKDLPIVWPEFDPAKDVVSLNEVIVTTNGSFTNPLSSAQVGWKVETSRNGLWDIFAGGRSKGFHQVNADGTLSPHSVLITGTAPSAGFAKGPGLLKLGSSVRTVRTVIKEFSWSTKTVANAAKALKGGAKSVVVKSRAEAEELFAGLFLGKGFKNTTGMSATEAKNFFGKAGTYHWDETVDATGRIIGHGANNAHGAMPHLQVHDEAGDIIRIFFK